MNGLYRFMLFLFSVFDEHAVDMTLEEFVKLLRGERWKAQVEEYQRLKASAGRQRPRS